MCGYNKFAAPSGGRKEDWFPYIFFFFFFQLVQLTFKHSLTQMWNCNFISTLCTWYATFDEGDWLCWFDSMNKIFLIRPATCLCPVHTAGICETLECKVNAQELWHEEGQRSEERDLRTWTPMWVQKGLTSWEGKKSQTVLERAASHEQRAFYSNDQMWGKEAVVADSSCVVIQNAAFPS